MEFANQSSKRKADDSNVTSSSSSFSSSSSSSSSEKIDSLLVSSPDSKFAKTDTNTNNKHSIYTFNIVKKDKVNAPYLSYWKKYKKRMNMKVRASPPSVKIPGTATVNDLFLKVFSTYILPFRCACGIPLEDEYDHLWELENVRPKRPEHQQKPWEYGGRTTIPIEKVRVWKGPKGFDNFVNYEYDDVVPYSATDDYDPFDLDNLRIRHRADLDSLVQNMDLLTVGNGMSKVSILYDWGTTTRIAIELSSIEEEEEVTDQVSGS